MDLTERGARLALDAYVVTSRLPSHVGERRAATVSRFVPGTQIHTLDVEAHSPGAAVTIVATHEDGHAGYTSIGERGKPMERVAREASVGYALWERSGAACDEHLADQLVLPAALASGTSRWTTPTVTEHLRTVIRIVEAFLPVRNRIDGGCVEIRAS